MQQITTVLGPIAPKALGFTSMHEHILLDMTFYRQEFGSTIPPDLVASGDDRLKLENIGLTKRNFIALTDNLIVDDEETMTAEVSDFRTSGGCAMVDMSVPGLRLNIPAIQRISRKTGVHVVATTGLYGEYSWPEKLREITTQGYADHMLKEIKDGIDDTGIKPGHIKVGITDMNKQQERLLRAAARVATETGLSITVHPGNGIGSDGRGIIKILVQEGMDLGRVIIAHAEKAVFERDLRTLVLQPGSWHPRLDRATAILDRGANLSFDNFGHYWGRESIGLVLETDWQRLAGLVALIENGYSPQIVLGTDTCMKMLVRRYGGEGYCCLTKFVVPTLRDLGVSDYDIRQMAIENPARLLAH